MPPPGLTRGTQAIGRAAAVLNAFQDHPTLSVAEAGRLLGLAPPTAHRVLRALVDADLVGQDPATSRYHLGPGAAAVGALASRRLRYEAARPELARLAATLGLSVTLGVNRGRESLIVETALPDAPDAIPVMPGMRAPVYACAMGKSISAYGGDGAHEPDAFTSYTEHTILSQDRLRAELEQVRFRGWAMNNEELNAGIRGLGAPIRDREGTAVAAVAIAATVARLDDAALGRATDEVLRSARRLAVVLVDPHAAGLSER